MTQAQAIEAVLAARRRTGNPNFYIWVDAAGSWHVAKAWTGEVRS